MEVLIKVQILFKPIATKAFLIIKNHFLKLSITMSLDVWSSTDKDRKKLPWNFQRYQDSDNAKLSMFRYRIDTGIWQVSWSCLYMLSSNTTCYHFYFWLWVVQQSLIRQIIPYIYNQLLQLYSSLFRLDSFSDLVNH